jgi:hypothetical protein
LGVAVLVAALHAPATALALTAHLIANGTGPLKDHAPGEDLRIGTGDDVIVSHPDSVGTNGSGPNTHGAASFAILNGSPGAPFPTWTNEALYGFDYILFVDGTLDFTADYAASTLSDLVVRITGCALRSTAEFNYAGGGPGSRGEATTTGCTGTGHFDPTTGTASVVITGTFAAPFDSLPLVDQTLTAAPGSATIVLKSSLGSSGNAYVDTVLAPLVPPNTTAVILVDFSGRTQEATHQDWATRGVLAAYTTDDLGCATGVLPCTGGSTTTTTLPLCSQYTTCEPALVAALPDPDAATGPARKVARMLRKLQQKAAKTFARAAFAKAARQPKLYAKTRSTLTRLGDVAAKADGRARLGVPLAAIQAALMRLLAVVPA